MKKSTNKEITKNLLKGHNCLDCTVSISAQYLFSKEVKKIIKKNRCKATLVQEEDGITFQGPLRSICKQYR